MKEINQQTSFEGRLLDYPPPVPAEFYRNILEEGRQRRERVIREMILQDKKIPLSAQETVGDLSSLTDIE